MTDRLFCTLLRESWCFFAFTASIIFWHLACFFPLFTELLCSKFRRWAFCVCTTIMVLIWVCIHKITLSLSLFFLHGLFCFGFLFSLGNWIMAEFNTGRWCNSLDCSSRDKNSQMREAQLCAPAYCMLTGSSTPTLRLSYQARSYGLPVGLTAFVWRKLNAQLLNWLLRCNLRQRRRARVGR